MAQLLCGPLSLIRSIIQEWQATSLSKDVMRKIMRAIVNSVQPLPLRDTPFFWSGLGTSTILQTFGLGVCKIPVQDSTRLSQWILHSSCRFLINQRSYFVSFGPSDFLTILKYFSKFSFFTVETKIWYFPPLNLWLTSMPCEKSVDVRTCWFPDFFWCWHR